MMIMMVVVVMMMVMVEVVVVVMVIMMMIYRINSIYKVNCHFYIVTTYTPIQNISCYKKKRIQTAMCIHCFVSLDLPLHFHL
jgi:hypothetical protein